MIKIKRSVFYFITFIIFLFILVACNNQSTEDRQRQLSYEINNIDIEHLKINGKVTKNTMEIDFQPELMEVLTVEGEQIYYISPPNNKSITGRMVISNGTDSIININLIGLQGNDSIFISIDGNKSSKVNKVSLEPNSKYIIPFDIEWNFEGPKEFTLFPMNDYMEHERYSSGTTGAMRFFVGNPDNVDQEIMDLHSKQYFGEINGENFFPLPEWLDDEFKPLSYKKIGNERVSIEKANTLKFSSVAYDGTVDLLWIDEYGNTDLLKSNHLLTQENTYVEFSDKQILKFYDNDHRQFILILSNREENLIADYKTYLLKEKPIFTTVTGVIEIYGQE